ncbi:Unknown protein [Striga hermonthica]|uniref:Reverse transcriptase zinc-binding domain-containing protein n=1 Tax=Striga hermonthica TaxID=68872 RepID=A0A9N7RQY4_STRHE|nr:Unknown protein [Striga hermonthica]
MAEEGSGWNLDLLQELFEENDKKAIQKMKSLDCTLKDRWIWSLINNGLFSVGKTYDTLILKKFRLLDLAEGSGSADMERKIKKKSWNLKITGKLKHFIWKCVNDVLPTSLKLKRRGLEVDIICQSCGEAEENLEHLFFHCVRAQRIWKIAPIHWEGMEDQHITFRRWWSQVCSVNKLQISEDRIQLTTYLLWWLWKSRNLWKFQNSLLPEVAVVNLACKEWWEYRTARS